MLKQKLLLRNLINFTMLCKINHNKFIKNIIIKDNNLPSLYLNDNNIFDIKNKKDYSVEHIYPKKFLDKKHHLDMHNLIRTNNIINNLRSNYKFTDKDDILFDKNWVKLSYGNYLNHHDRLFIPNDISKGFISRTIMYLAWQYGYNPYKIISHNNLINWCLNNPPDYKERYHNEVVNSIQFKNNIFISNYNNKDYYNQLKKLF